jgi:hypothetical protein
LKWQNVFVNGAGCNMQIQELWRLIHAAKIPRGINMPYMRGAKSKNIFANIAAENIRIFAHFALIRAKKAQAVNIHRHCKAGNICPIIL